MGQLSTQTNKTKDLSPKNTNEIESTSCAVTVPKEFTKTDKEVNKKKKKKIKIPKIEVRRK